MNNDESHTASHNTMNKQEFTAALDTYGSDLGSWPSVLAAQANALLVTDSEARQLLAQQESVEQLLEQMPQPVFPGLQNRVLQQPLPAQSQSWAEQLVDWLIPEQGFSMQWWRPLSAACLPMLVGIVMSNYFTFGVVVADQGFQAWDDELVMLSLTDTSEAATLP